MKKLTFFTKWLLFALACFAFGYIFSDVLHNGAKLGELTIFRISMGISYLGIAGLVGCYLITYFEYKNNKSNVDKDNKDNKNKIVIKKSVFIKLFVFACFAFIYIFAGILHDVLRMANLEEVVIFRIYMFIGLVAVTVALGCFLIIDFKSKNNEDKHDKNNGEGNITILP